MEIKKHKLRKIIHGQWVMLNKKHLKLHKICISEACFYLWKTVKMVWSKNKMKVHNNLSSILRWLQRSMSNQEKTTLWKELWKKDVQNWWKWSKCTKFRKGMGLNLLIYRSTLIQKAFSRKFQHIWKTSTANQFMEQPKQQISLDRQLHMIIRGYHLGQQGWVELSFHNRFMHKPKNTTTNTELPTN